MNYNPVGMTTLAYEQSAPRRFPISVEVYRLMAEKGAFAPDERVELIDGEIIEMSPIGPRHARVVDFLNEFLTSLPKRDFIVRIQNSVVLDDFSQPQPDVTLVKRRDDFYRYELPNNCDVVLAIEVADSTVVFDRSVKLPKYSDSGIPECWLVDLDAERVEVHSQPKEGTYGAVKIYKRDETVVS
ncbi:MAG TPA: Uma2 family endonuclease [Pyrinomonadaceae bacterium]|nr:Uma2 family endonuclease [Pyrinomonadaceae bacterium]